MNHLWGQKIEDRERLNKILSHDQRETFNGYPSETLKQKKYIVFRTNFTNLGL